MNVIPIVDTMPADLLTPLSVYLKLAGEGRCSFLLESVEGGEALARYSFIGADPHTVVAGGRERVTITSGTSTTELRTPLWAYLRKHFAGLEAAADPDLPSFIGGAIGYFGFNCSSWFEPSILNDISRAVGILARQDGRHIHLVLENDDNRAGLLDPSSGVPNGRYRAQWNDDYHHVWHVILTQETHGYYEDYAIHPRHLLAVHHGQDSTVRVGGWISE